MIERNIDFEIPMTREQWEQVGRRAAALGPEEGGFQWSEDEPDRIHVFLREEEARGLWENFVSDEDVYGDQRIELAQFVFNDGDPYGHLEAPTAADEPAINSVEEDSMAVGQERFVRDKWHQLLRESGIHYVRGHV